MTSREASILIVGGHVPRGEAVRPAAFLEPLLPLAV
jgi:hypothetical protein